MKFKKILSLLLVVLFVAQMIPMSAMAVDTGDIDLNTVVNESENEVMDDSEIDIDSIIDAGTVNAEEEPEIIGEVEERREASVKHFRRADGSFVAAVYGEPIHYKTNGEWKEIDNTLSLSDKQLSETGKATYVNKASSMPVSIPQDLSGGQKITLTSSGYTVGFGVSGKNSGVKLQSEAAVKDVEALESSKIMNKENTPESFNELQDEAADPSLPGIENKKEDVKLEAEDPTAVKNTTSAVTYTDVFPGADIEYIVTPTKVKENIVVKSRHSVYSYKFDMDFGGLVPVRQEDGSIDLVEKDEDGNIIKKAFTIQAPYMYDANGVYGYDVSMSVESNGELYILKVTADESWVNNEERAFPVVIDPTIINTDQADIRDTDVNSYIQYQDWNFHTNPQLLIGKSGSSVARAYYKVVLPELPNDSVITYTDFVLYRDTSLSSTSNDTYFKLYDLRGFDPWSIDLITWNTQPVPGSYDLDNPNFEALDYCYFPQTDGGFAVVDYHFDITRLAKNWYAGYYNNGFMIKAYDESVAQTGRFFTVDNPLSILHPQVSISYVNNTGLEPYWTYESIDLGRSGVAYINHFNGSLTYIHDDVSLSGNRMPISVNHVYTTNKENATGTYGNMKLGAGFRLNIMEQIKPVPVGLLDSEYKYMLIDGDGTAHYFIEVDVNTYVHEYDYSIELIKQPNNTFVLQDSSGNIKKYRSTANNGFLYEMEDSNGNKQEITFSNGRITAVTEMTGGTGRSAEFNYDSSGYLETITDPAGRETLFDYSGGKLESIYYTGGGGTFISYNPSGNITQIDTYDTSRLAIEYKVDVDYEDLSFIANVDLYGKFVAGGQRVLDNYLEFDYESGMTVVEDKYGKVNSFIFDSVGRTINIRDEAGRSVSTSYYNYSDTNKNNKPQYKSTIQSFSDNLLRNHDFESGNWSGTAYLPGSVGIVTSQSYLGDKSMKVEKTDLTTGRNAAIQEFAGTVGKTYTLSAYLKIPEAIEVNGGGAWIGFAYEKDGAWYLNTSSRGALIAEACGWTRYSTTFTVPSGATGELRIYLALENAEGTVYFDSVQLEEGSGANQYNLIENPQFKYGDDNWNQAYLYNQGEVGLFNGRNAFYIYGEPDLSFLCVMQSITLNADEGDTVMFGMEAYANVADFTSMSDFAGIMIYFFDDNENFLQSDGLPFNAGITKTQTCIKSTTLEGDCASAIVILYFNSQINYAAFQKIALYVGDGGSSYGYNGSGRLTSVVNGVGDKISYTYDSPYSPDVTKVTTYKNGVTLDYTEFTYDSNHNIETATAKNGIVTEYTYNAYGSPIKIKTISFDSYSSTEIFMSYTQDGQYLTALTDEYGEESTFTYNINKGLLTSATDPNANTVEYTYDAYTDELLSTSGSGQVDMTTTYEYDHNALTEISRNGVTYSYTYDSLNRVTESKVGSQTLVETTYNANSTIDTLTYGNDDSVEFEYDSLDRVKEVSYNGIGKFNYVYNNEDQVTRIGDLENDRIWTYNYDILSRVTDIALKKPDESIRARLEYDDRSNTSGMTVTKDGNILTDADYTYTADENLPDRTTLNSMDSGYIDYVYDSLNRVNHLEHTMKASASTEGFRTSFTYDDSSGNDTSRVSDIRYIERSGGSGTLLGTLSYTYDANGNIRTIKEDNQLQVTYTYDGLNQLVREDNAEAGYTITYAYDTGGNMTSKEYYAYTTGTPGTVLGQIPFSYGGPGCWNDQLTDYGGIPLEYDEIGNLTHFGDEDVGNIYFEWQNGRQLAAITDD